MATQGHHLDRLTAVDATALGAGLRHGAELVVASMGGREIPGTIVSVLQAAAAGGYATATDLADWLVRSLGLPFREAHHVTGRVVAAAEARRLPLDQMPLEALQAIHPRITADVFSILSVEASVRSRTSYGGTAPQNVRKMARGWTKRLEKALPKG